MDSILSLMGTYLGGTQSKRRRTELLIAGAAEVLQIFDQGAEVVRKVIEEPSKRTCHKRRSQRRPKNYKTDSRWGRMLWGSDGKFNPELRTPETKAAKQFRSRFRLPFSSFENLCHLASVLPCCTYAEADVTGRLSIPVELKLLGVLRILGRGWYLVVKFW